MANEVEIKDTLRETADKIYCEVIAVSGLAGLIGQNLFNENSETPVNDFENQPSLEKYLYLIQSELKEVRTTLENIFERAGK